MAYNYSLQHSFLNFDAALDDVTLPVWGSLACAFQFKLPIAFDSVTSPSAITIELTDIDGVTITTIGSAIITDLCANASMAGITDDSFPLGVYQTRDDLFAALSLLGYTATDFNFFQCCTDLPNSVTTLGVTINFSRGIISVVIPDVTATNFSTATLVDIDQCFKIAVNINATRLLSNPFIRVFDKEFLTWTAYSNNEDAYDFYYPDASIENRLWLPLYITKPAYPEDRKIYIKSNKVYKVLKASIEKEWEGRVNFFPDKMHDRVVVALAHDNVHFLNDKIDDFIYKKTDDYEIDWSDDPIVDVAQAKFKLLQTFAGRNSNCEQRMPCDIGVEPPPLCIAVVVANTVLPDARVNQAYNVSVPYTGTAPVTISGETGPAWMGIALGIGVVHLTGTPAIGDDTTGVTVAFLLTNCTGIGTDTFSDTIDVLPPAVVIVACGGSTSGTWASNSSHNYGFFRLDTVTGSPSSMSVAWNTNSDRPNRFTIRNDTDSIVVQTTGWVGVAAYAGPWGASLSTAQTGTLTFNPVAGKLYSVQVETANGNPVSPQTDNWSFAVTCVSHIPITGEITMFCSDGGCSHQGLNNLHFDFGSPTPAILTILFGQVISTGTGNKRDGDNIMIVIPTGTIPDDFYDTISHPEGHKLPFSVLNIPAGTSSYDASETIWKQGYESGGDPSMGWVCHSCETPITDIWVKIAQTGYAAAFTINPLNGATIHNV